MSDTYQHGPGSIVSPQSPGERKKPHLIQMPPRTFSHRSSSHVITLTRIWAPITGPCIVPRLYSQRMAFCLCGQVEATANSPAPSFLYEARSPLWLSACQSFLEEKHNSKRFILTCTHNYVQAWRLWWAGQDLNLQCHTNPIYSRGWYQLHSTDPYIIIKMPVLKSLVIENYTSQRMPVWPNAKLGAAVLQLLGHGGMVERENITR